MIQSEVAHIRTDLDRFSPLDITALVQHGYCVARKQCRTRPDLYGSNLPSGPPWDPMKVSDAPGSQHARTAPSAEDLSRDASPPVTALVTRQAQQLRRSAGRRVWSTLLDLRDWPTYVYIPLLVLLLVVLPVQVYRYRRQANTNAMIVDAITHGSPDFRKILEIVQRSTTPAWTPLPVQDVSRASPKGDYRGFEFVSDTSIVDLRDWRSKTRDVAHYYRRVRIRKRANEDRMVLQYPRLPFDRIDFHAGPEKLKPVVRRVPPEAGGGKTTWELEFDLSDVRTGSPTDIEIEATIHDFEARKGERENWLRILAALHDGAGLRVGAFPGISAIQGLPPHPLRGDRPLHVPGDRDPVHDRPPLRLDHRLVDRQPRGGLRLRVQLDDGMSRLAPWRLKRSDDGIRRPIRGNEREAAIRCNRD